MNFNVRQSSSSKSLQSPTFPGDARRSEKAQRRLAKPRDNLDVNADYRITALDALQVINELGRRGGTAELAAPYRPTASYVDVNGNGEVSALDALQVINALARIGSTGPRVLTDGSGYASEQTTLVTVGQ